MSACLFLLVGFLLYDRPRSSSLCATPVHLVWRVCSYGLGADLLPFLSNTQVEASNGPNVPMSDELLEECEVKDASLVDQKQTVCFYPRHSAASLPVTSLLRRR